MTSDETVGKVWLVGTIVCAAYVVLFDPLTAVVAWGIMSIAIFGSKVIGLI